MHVHTGTLLQPPSIHTQIHGQHMHTDILTQMCTCGDMDNRCTQTHVHSQMCTRGDMDNRCTQTHLLPQPCTCRHIDAHSHLLSDIPTGSDVHTQTHGQQMHTHTYSLRHAHTDTAHSDVHAQTPLLPQLCAHRHPCPLRCVHSHSCSLRRAHVTDICVHTGT